MMAIMAEWGADLLVGPGGDLAVTSAGADVQQRIIRRLLTHPGDYIWHPDYGAGLGRFIGGPSAPPLIQGVILGQIRNETLVASDPQPLVATAPLMDGSRGTVSVTVRYQVIGAKAFESVVINPDG